MSDATHLGPSRHELTFKQRQVIDYMKGNGGVLGVRGWHHLTGPRGLTNRGLAQVLSALTAMGLVEHADPPAPDPRDWLTDAGRHA
jgi:hypothetical protein